MADQDEKMVALKKAYAEIILNTAKEAAARVMASERRALSFEYDLRNAKDEAVRMLLRLKQTIGAKTTESEITSLGQQKKIEELDAQLNEAEGVIIDLREELGKAYDQLEVAKNSHMQQSNGPPENESMVYFKNTADEKQFRSFTQCGTYSNRKETETSRPGSNNFFLDNTNLATIINGSKEPELYRNGYTHRIRAIERNLLDEKNLSENQHAEEICTKELIIHKDENSSEKCSPSSTNAENTDTEKVNLKDDYLGKDESLTENDACTLRRSIRKRKVRCWEDISSLFKSRAALSRCKKYSSNAKSVAEVNPVFVPITPSTNASEKEAGRVLSTNFIIETDTVQRTDSVLVERTGGAACGTDRNKLLKYTFSRKRKTDLSYKSDNCSSLGKSLLTGKMEEKPNLIEDPSSDSQNMVEVACQLISLSGEHKW